jgi:RNA polymerase sigma factor (sigma-70 family)
VGVPTGRGADASDVVQEAFWYVAARVDDFRGHSEAELLAWLQRTLRFRAIDLSRKRALRTCGRDRATESQSNSSTPLRGVEAHQTSPSERAIRNEHEEQILQAASALSDEQLLVVLLREIDGCRLRAIADEFGFTPAGAARLFYEGIELIESTGPGAPQAALPSPSEAPIERLHSALHHLPSRQRQAVELMHVENFTLDEIAEAADCEPRTAAAAAALIHRGLRKLKAMVGADKEA